MPFLRRRVVKLALTALILTITLLLIFQPAGPPQWTFRVKVGVGDKEPTDWSGKVAVSGGEVAAIEGWRFEIADRVDGNVGWKCATHEHIAFGKRLPLQQADGKPRTKEEDQPWPNGVTLAIRGKQPQVTITFAQGVVKFDASKVRPGEPLAALDGKVVIERLPDTSVLRPPAKQNAPDAVQDDYPAFWVHYKTGKQYLAWIAYQNEKDRVLLAEREGPDGAWSEPREVAKAGYHFRAALATVHDGTLWIVWSEMVEQRWNLYARPYKDGKLGTMVRLSDDPGPDMWHRMTTDSKGRAWLVWQGFRKGRSHIFARCADEKGWHDPVKVSDGSRNAWDPCITADPTADRVWVGWDEYQKNTYGVAVAALENGPNPKQKPIMAPDPCPYFQAHLSLACDKEGRLWAAWDESGPQWGKDNGFLYGGQFRQDTTRLYGSRSIRVRVLTNPNGPAPGVWHEPKAAFTSCLPLDMREYNELPQLQPDSDGRMWLAFRHRTCRKPREDGWSVQSRWEVFATAYLGEKWLAPIELPRSAGRNDMRVSSQRDSAGHVYFAHASDNRTWLPPYMSPKNLSIAVNRIYGAAEPGQMELVPRKRNFPLVADCHPDEAAQVKRIRNYTVAIAGKKYHIYRGDLHRHTDISLDGAGDGTLMDLHRYALDVAALDYVLVGDHNMGHDDEYCWWRTQQANDMYTVPGAFISMYGYERSVKYPNGHRNIIWTKRGYKTLHVPKPTPPALKGDTAKLYVYLKDTGGICTSHTSASDQGTDWEDPHDPELEPFVEIFQGYHTSYEAPGAPKSIDDKTDRVHGKFESAGFVSHALAKGYKLGFQSSSDHISTHVSYACILAEEFSRKGIVEAMKKRHTYAATDNIIMDVRIGSALMGDEVKTAKPKLDVIVLGTGPLDRVEVLRDSKVIHTAKLGDNPPEEARFSWEDPNPTAGDKASYYYVRVTQLDGQMAWSSPIWVKAK